MDTNTQNLNHSHVHKLRSYLNKTYSLLNSIAIISILNYRISFFINQTSPTTMPSWLWLLLSLAELLFSLIWILRQPLYWHPITRAVFPERLPEDRDLPGIDVLVFTSDPNREPTFAVMNTVVSAMAMDYPAKKMSVYLSDDGGDVVTLMGLKEAWCFATWWLPFVNKYNVKPPSPMAYFGQVVEEEMECHSMEFHRDRMLVKEKYDAFKQRVESNITPPHFEDEANINARDHSPLIQLVDVKSVEDNAAALINSKFTEMPLVAYVAREKRLSHPHNFKAGAINVLLRISSIITNSPYILILDCDMHCNDTISARQAMCFFLDPVISPSIGWVQFPQRFHNVDDNDMYDYQTKDVVYQGLDGLQGPWISGTNVYIKRETLYAIDVNNGTNLLELRHYFGPSNDFIRSMNYSYKGNRDVSANLQQEAKFLASCTYEKGTKWGQEVGFQYFTTSEDVMTSFFFHSKGWRSIYLSPARPQFLGLATTNLNDVLTQGIRLYSGLFLIGLSKYCPLIYNPSKMRFPTKMCYSWIVLRSFEVLPLLCFGIVPPLCLFYGTPLYPKVSDPSFIPFSFAIVSSQVKNLYECCIDGRSTTSWLSEQRIWMVRGVTSHAYGALNCLMIKLRIREGSFIPTNKSIDLDKSKYYHLGKYDFRTSNMYLVPIVALVILNMVCFVGGVARMVIARDWDSGLFVQVGLSMYLLVMSFPVIEGVVLRVDDGRVPSSAKLISSIVCMVLLALGYLCI